MKMPAMRGRAMRRVSMPCVYPARRPIPYTRILTRMSGFRRTTEMTTAQPVDDLGYDAIEASALVAGDFRDPYPDLAARREETPIQRGDFIPDIPREPDGPETFTVYSCDLVSQVLRDSQHFTSQVYAEHIGPA